MKSIVLLSAPAGGKGTISKYIENKYNYDHISVGDLLRDEAKKNKDIDTLLKSGSLLDDDFVLNILQRRLEKQTNDFVLDGFPRNINQASKLDKLFKDFNIELQMVICINVDKDVLEKRINSRVICDKCKSVYNLLKDEIIDNKCPNCENELIHRNDDKKSTFETRYKVFESMKKDILSYFNDYKEIKNNTDINEAYKQIDALMKGDN